MLDISDGLAKDASRIARASAVSIEIDPLMLQGFEAVLEEAARAIGASESDWVLFGGEDHALLATFPPNAELPREFKPIGVVVKQSSTPVSLGANPLPEKGWDSVNG